MFIAESHKDFVIYYRLLPWDHAPGALILSEAGGRAEHREPASEYRCSCMHIRDILPADLPAVLALNNAHAREVNALTATDLERLVVMAARARVIDGGLGFLVALDETTPAQGPNHSWFLARRSPFLYVDRVVVAEAVRGRGYARALYEDLSSVAAGRVLCCEVNVDPPNPASMAFHEKLGFLPCGEGEDPRNGKRVRYLHRPP